MKRLLLFLCTISWIASSGQSLDPNFNAGLLTRKGAYIYTMVKQNDGKVILEGNPVYVNGIFTTGLFRLNSDSSFDPNFHSSHDGTIVDFAFQPDGKIVVSGSFTLINGKSVRNLARLNTDGSLDETFAPPDTASRRPGIAVATDRFGRTVLLTTREIFRLNTDGSLDNDFASAVVPGGSAGDLLIQANGRIVMVGFFDFRLKVISGSGPSIGKMVGLTETGALDETFGGGAQVSDFLRIGIVLPAGEDIIIASGIRQPGHDPWDPGIARLNKNGFRDHTFAPNVPLEVLAVVVQPTGKILVNLRNYHLNRLALDGTIDSTFHFGISGEVGKVIQYDANRMFAVTQAGLKFLNNDGKEISDPKAFVCKTADVVQIAVDRNGRLLVGGSISLFNGIPCANLVAMNRKGNPDNSFTFFSKSEINSFAIRKDNKLYVSVSPEEGGIALANVDGTRDIAFNPGKGFDDAVRAIAILPDGKIMVGGDFKTYNNIPVNRCVRLNTDGTLDTGFNCQYPFSSVSLITAQPDGKVLVYDKDKSLIRFNMDGAIDLSIGSGFISVIRLDAAGNIYLGGQGFRVDTEYRLFAKLSPSGAVLAESNNIRLANGTIYDIRIQNDGKLLLGGRTIWSGDRLLGELIRLNADCTLDESFVDEFNFEETVKTIFMSSSDVFVGGDFTLATSPVRASVGIIHNMIINGISGDSGPSRDILSIYPNPVKNIVQLSMNNTYAGRLRVDIVNNAGKTIDRQEFQKDSDHLNININLESQLMPPGVYTVIVQFGRSSIFRRVIKL